MSNELHLSEGTCTRPLAKVLKGKIDVSSLPDNEGIIVASGFLSEHGFLALFGTSKEQIREIGRKVAWILVGKLTNSCANLMDFLSTLPEYRGKLFVNLGLGKLTLRRDKVTGFRVDGRARSPG